MLILRKADRKFDDENISSAKELVLKCTNSLGDYKKFLDECIERLYQYEKNRTYCRE